jgi:hypothetical protein
MEFQNQILQSFLWHFTEQKFSNIGNFRFAVKDYNEKITDEKFQKTWISLFWKPIKLLYNMNIGTKVLKI